MTTLEELLHLEHLGWKSLCESTGADFYGSIMTDDAVMVLSHGFVFDKAAVIASLNDSPPWRNYQIADERLIPLGNEAAILVYTGRAYRDASEPAFVGLMCSSYVRDESEWRLALYQQTPVPTPES